MKYYALLILLSSILFGCKQSATTEKQSDEVERVIETTKEHSLPSIPTELLQQIYLECDFVDYIFYELPFSMSYDNQTTIQSVLRWVNEGTDIPSAGCKALGRMIFQKKGEIMIEAEIYVSESCSYYKWIENGKPVYNNLMSHNGFVHYSGIIKQYENRK